MDQKELTSRELRKGIYYSSVQPDPDDENDVYYSSVVSDGPYYSTVDSKAAGEEYTAVEAEVNGQIYDSVEVSQANDSREDEGGAAKHFGGGGGGAKVLYNCSWRLTLLLSALAVAIIGAGVCLGLYLDSLKGIKTP